MTLRILTTRPLDPKQLNDFLSLNFFFKKLFILESDTFCTKSQCTYTYIQSFFKVDNYLFKNKSPSFSRGWKIDISINKSGQS